MKRTVTTLSKKQLNKRYLKLADTRMAKLTKEALESGYSIARIEQDGLHRSNCLVQDIRIALEYVFPKTSEIQIWGFTDMSELHKDTLYCAFKEIPLGNLSGHSCFKVVTSSSSY